jgi:Recombinase zinc beta ribbon domain
LRSILLDAEIFDQVQEVLMKRWSPQKARSGKRPKDSTPMASRMTDRVWPLQGLARCKICGSALTVSCSMGARGKVCYFYLRCSGQQQRVGTSCTASLLPASTWEQGVIDSLI